MPDSDHVSVVVQEWFHKAANDLTTAQHTLLLGEAAPFDTICFHAQQCVEKSLKAILSRHATPFGRTHDIESLVRLLPAHLLSDWPIGEQRLLTTYATSTRYPGEYEPVTRSEAESAVSIASSISGRLAAHLADLA